MGRDDMEWRSWNFVFMAYCGAAEVEPQVEIRNALAATDPKATLNMSLSASPEQLSQTLYYMAVMLMEDGAL